MAEHVANLLQMTAGLQGSDARKASEVELQNMRSQPGFLQVLIGLANCGDKTEMEKVVSHSASIYFKNTIKHCWNVPPGQPGISPQDKEIVRQQLLPALTSLPKYAAVLFSDAVRIVAACDYPVQWQTFNEEAKQHLLAGLQAFGAGQVFGGCQKLELMLQTVHVVLSKYRDVDLDEQVKDEIMPIITTFGEPVFVLLQQFNAAVAQAPDGKTAAAILSALQSCIEVIRDLTALDLGGVFEDKFKTFIDLLQAAVQFTPSGPVLQALAEEDTFPLEDAKAEALQLLSFWLEKYDEDFMDKVDPVTQAVYGLLTYPSLQEPHWDGVVVAASQYLQSIARGFHGPKLLPNLAQLVSLVLVPNLLLRDSDLEMFEDEPDDYVTRNIEGSDLGTRRRATSDLLQALNLKFPEQLVPVCKGESEGMLQKYAASPQEHWNYKEACIYFLTALSTKQTVSDTAVAGVKKETASQIFDVNAFFAAHILPELQQTKASRPQELLLKASALSFVASFRTVIPPESYIAFVGLVTTWLECPNEVVVTFAAHTLGKLIAGKLISKEQLAQGVGPLFQALLTAMSKSKKDNQFLAECLLRVVGAAEETLGAHIPNLLDALRELVFKVSKSEGSSSNVFVYYIFESIATLLQKNKAQVAVVEEKLYGPFAENILQKDLVEFMPYVFQIYAQMLEARGQVLECYRSLLPLLLSGAPTLLQPGLLPGVLRLLTAYCRVDVSMAQNMDPIASLACHALQYENAAPAGFELLSAIIMTFPDEAVSKISPAFRALAAYLAEAVKSAGPRSTATRKYAPGMICFLAAFVTRVGRDHVLTLIQGGGDAVRPGGGGDAVKHVLIFWASALPSMRDARKSVASIALARCISHQGVLQGVAEWPRVFEKLCISAFPHLAAGVSAASYTSSTFSSEQQTEDNAVFKALNGAKQPFQDWFHGQTTVEAEVQKAFGEMQGLPNWGNMYLPAMHASLSRQKDGQSILGYLGLK